VQIAAEADNATQVARLATVYTVQSGDTLLGIAKQYGVPMAAIQLANDMGGSTVVRLGEVLSIPSASAWELASPYWLVHVVGAGESLLGIARTYDLELATMATVNDLADVDCIVVGQSLVVPLDGPAAPRVPTPSASPTSVRAEVVASPTPGSPTLTVSVASPEPMGPVAESVLGDEAGWPHETVRIINSVRATHGLPPLMYNETLALAAQAQANDCATRGWCSHTGSDGADIKTRILRTGYEPANWAECWAQRQSPQGAVDIWMNEVPPNDPHRRTLLTTWLSEIGLGVAKTDWGYYFIAVFGRPR